MHKKNELFPYLFRNFFWNSQPKRQLSTKIWLNKNESSKYFAILFWNNFGGDSCCHTSALLDILENILTYLFFFSISVLEEYRACKENSYVNFIVNDFSAGPSLNRDDWKCYNFKNTYIGLILLHQLSLGFIINFAQMNNFMKYLMVVFVNTLFNFNIWLLPPILVYFM